MDKPGRPCSTPCTQSEGPFKKTSEQKDHMHDIIYLMENDEEISRLEMKTDPEEVRRQALWAGLKPG
jgi:hypothetical protein